MLRRNEAPSFAPVRWKVQVGDLISEYERGEVCRRGVVEAKHENGDAKVRWFWPNSRGRTAWVDSVTMQRQLDDGTLRLKVV